MSFILPTVETLTALRARMDGYGADQARTALVPTMGALHEGHLSLVRIAKRVADRVIVSIFVNPTQFAPGEDFEAYPRDMQADLKLLAQEGVDLVYLPSRPSMYQDDHSTSLIIGGVGDGLETDHRPTFFHGVALVVNKLFNRVRPDIAVFGEKDFQQLAVIRRMVRDLDMPVEIIGAPIARDAQGLALSSRNRYFDAEALAVARQLNRILFDARDHLQTGADVATTLQHTHRNILDSGFSDVDYVSLADATSLNLQNEGVVTDKSRLLIAAHCRGVRLIDNCAVNAPTTEDTSL
ncbi:pantothenate synthetase [Algimonas ampicilliniresistens]|uniref:Pantothenate synthetase n=1 Tax=Algimonas ampicilliniresistens TaxID=1298735 RepID=A0ABQ5VCN8_9PROT|nr:pantoate--beta-alanine ligase [Algimonas ampicilliniresistens]GLQ24837.1 pantothenate synthetase [Algimonas ampicilliniresistens]